MKTCYPIRKANGKDFATVEEVMTLLNGEAHGTWLLGVNSLWHGGIHFSHRSVPHSVLTEDNINDDKAVPLQCMADGKIVAYRLNNYQSASYGGKSLSYSSAFLLVRSTCQPKADDNETWLTFYTLYLHLAPVSDYPKKPCYKIKAGKTDIQRRKYTAGNKGIPAGTTAPYEEKYKTPDKNSKLRSLNGGDRFVVDHTGGFYQSDKETTPETFGLARKIKDGKPESDLFWVTLKDDLVESDGDMTDLMPEWVSKASERGIRNDVVIVPEEESWEIKAGEPIGFIGLTEMPDGRAELVEKDYFVHLEVLSTDPNMPQFLSNPKAVTEGKKYIKALQDSALFLRADETTTPPVFQATENTLTTDAILTRDAATPVKDADEVEWFKVLANSWVQESDVEAFCQYDLMKLGFIPLEENTAGDVTEHVYEPWVQQAFSGIAKLASEAPGMDYARVPMAYQNLITAMDSNNDGQIDADEVRQALTMRDPLVQQVVNRLVVKHHSEWFENMAAWQTFYDELAPQDEPYNTQWQKDMEWMSKVAPFDKGEAVWHFHPVVFFDSLSDNELIRVNKFLDEYEKEHKSFATDTPALSAQSKTNLKKLLENLNLFYSTNSDYKPNLYYISYMLATTRHESYHFTTQEFFSEKPEVGSESYFDKYDPILADTQARRDRAVQNENTVQGDGYSYRGRGCVHLTWKINYRKAKEKYGVDFVTEPDLAGDFKYAVPIMVWGMEEGIFSGKKLSDFINVSGIDYEGARRIINGNDQKVLIATYAEKFQNILEKTSSIPKGF